MPFKPNYRLQRADRQRAKEEKQQKKLLRRTEREATHDTDPQGMADGEPTTHGVPEASKAEPHS